MENGAARATVLARAIVGRYKAWRTLGTVLDPSSHLVRRKSVQTNSNVGEEEALT